MKKTEQTNYIQREQLAQYGKETAQGLQITGSLHGSALSKQMLARLRQLERSCRDVICAQPTPEAEWLADNLYVVRRDSKAAAADFQHVRQLRTTSGGVVVWLAAEALVIAGQGQVDAARLRVYLQGFQEVLCLEERELCLLCPALRGCLVAYLAENVKAAEAVFGSLRWLDTADLRPLLEAADAVEAVLRQDPAGVYPAMDTDSREDYRRQTVVLARRYHVSEPEAAQTALTLAREQGRHVGYFLFDRPLGNPAKKKPYGCYLGVNLLLTLAAALYLSYTTHSLACLVLTLLPLGEAVKYLTDQAVILCKRPTRLPRLDYTAGIPSHSRTLAVTAVLLSSPEAARKAARKLAEYRLANRDAGSQLVFGLLADLPEASEQHGEQDQVTLAAAAAEIDRLNQAYGGFCLLTRPRHYSQRDRVWRGWERKRGAVISLCCLLRGEDGGVSVSAGDPGCVADIRYLIVLDGDTRLTVGAAGKLAGTIAHPLNAAKLDRVKRRVVSGYGIVQPRVTVSLADACRSDFSRVFAGQGGLDPYGSLNSDVYQDLFGEGSFSGKGILDVDAFYTCLKGRFPLHTLLSHDLVEGSYLGCAYAGDVELMDGFPTSLLSYYERQHRWIRGDWQTLPWLFRRVADEEGVKRPNPISPLAKWKILDNLRRSLVPAALFLSLILYGLLGGIALRVCALTALGCLALKVLISSASAVRDGFGRYHSGVLSAAVSDFLQLCLLLLLLPYAAYVSVSAVLTALYRMLISRRGLLQWVTAAESDQKHRGGLVPYLRRMSFCFLAGVLGLLGGSIVIKALAVFWLLTPLIGHALSREKTGSCGASAAVSDEKRLFLLHCAGDIWRYFSYVMTPERGYLPPDNLQEEPEEMIAERTSPTNIGLWLLSAVAAWDLGLEKKETVFDQIAQTLDTLERLPKFRGHLYNWYDLRTKKPLLPAYISTVDSGNLLACLLVLQTAAREADKPALAERAAALAAAMPLDFLYDPERRLLRIGWDPEKDEPSGGWYDLLESEARTASYIAIARGEAPQKHWRRLGRTLTGSRGSGGLASWTGTMFEYFMPSLFLPVYPGSLLAESQSFCYKAQKSRCAEGVWGISESAFYSLDAAMSYRYKAHGVQKLALRRGMDRDLVIAPYAAFLALMQSCAVVRNLRRLRKLGAEGRFGFYEALDFTASRTEGRPFVPVRCFMSHHLAMSLLAVDNTLNGGLMRQRFLADPAMAACTELLQEKSPVGQRIRASQDPPTEERPERSAAAGFHMGGEGFSLAAPNCAALSSGKYHVLISELGGSRSLGGQTLLAAYEPSRFSPQQGLLFYASCGGAFLPLQPAPAYGGELRYHHEFDGVRFRQYARGCGLSFCTETRVPAGFSGETRTITLREHSGAARDVTLALYFEPALSAPAAYAAHPAFQRLCMESKLVDGCLLLSRRPGGTERACTAAIHCTEAFEAETDQVLALGRGGLRALPSAMQRSGTGVRAAGEPCVLLRLRISLRPKEAKTLRFSIALEDTPERARATAIKLSRTSGEQDRFRHYRTAYGLGGEALSASLRLLTELVFDTEEKRRLRQRYAPWDRGRDGLWTLGVSGDLPVAVAGDDGETMLRAWALWRAMGFSFDLLLPVQDAGVYGRPEYTALTALAASLGQAGMLGQRGGFHIVSGEETALNGALARADAYGLPPKGKRTEAKVTEPFFLPVGAENRAPRTTVSWEDGYTFRIERGAGLRAWTDVLTNGRLGYLATDTGSGNLWLDNARENRLTPWYNAPLALRGPERLELIRDGAAVSLFADADAHATQVHFGFGETSWRRRIGPTETALTAFIPQEGCARVFLLKLQDWREGDRIRWFILPEKDGQAPEWCASAAPLISWDDELALRTNGAASGGRSCLCLEYAAADTLVLVLGMAQTARYAEPAAALSALEACRAHWRQPVGSLSLQSPDQALDTYLNGWAVYQTLACRMLGRNSIYQSGGAYGFRDQLQDACALTDAMPELALSQLLRAAAHQYTEGDVMHWWHPQSGGDKGVRTHCSDDLLWLIYAASVYVGKTGDAAALERTAPWLSSPVLAAEERDRYETPAMTGQDSLLIHCQRAAGLVLARGTGPHGLLWFGAGDWNDGFDRVGGESVWLTWFAALTLGRFAALTGDESLKGEAAKLGRAADASWDQGQYLRGFYADGRPLGAAGSAECAIDSLSQSFAVLSGWGDPVKGRAAVKKAAQQLLDSDNRLVRLFTPPFDGKEDPGYIRSYLPGVRENGGQYTHGAVWLAAACLRCGEAALGWQLLKTLLPSGREETVYQTEPFVLAADVYANPDMTGRGGWTWYTGAAGWFLRTAVEELLGLRTADGALQVRPVLPPDWDGYQAEYTACGQRYAVRVWKEGDTLRNDVKKM